MKEFKYKYKGYGIHDSECLVKMYEVNNITYILFKDLGIGTSVTNASEELASQIVVLENLNPNNCRFFETYDFKEIDEIKYNWIGNKAYKPIWSHINNPKIFKF